MSSLRNAVNRRVHKERAQPLERSRYGLLEKHKDYSLRAKDHNQKKAQLAALRRKAADRNEDEFYFGMLSRSGPSTRTGAKGKRWTGTVDGDRGNRALDVDAVRLLKTQDVGYLRTVRQVASKEARALEERVIALGGRVDGEDEDDEDIDILPDLEGMEGFQMPASLPLQKTTAKPKKTVFADDTAEREERIQDLEKEEDEAEIDENSTQAERTEQRKRLLGKLQRRLRHARQKLRVLARAEHELEVQRAHMAKTPTAGNGVTKAGKKFKVRERKR
ncbi:U3 small nucleolar RNA-associated protein 11 [Xylariomycetidae sp. FL0641]|nr:U3 small nucleolar RNA-associated protein 11 [Xylariomycetidae sp. FL0641]